MDNANGLFCIKNKHRITALFFVFVSIGTPVLPVMCYLTVEMLDRQNIKDYHATKRAIKVAITGSLKSL